MVRRIVALAAVACLAAAPSLSAQGNGQANGVAHRVSALENTVKALQAALEGVDPTGLAALQAAVDALQQTVVDLQTALGDLQNQVDNISGAGPKVIWSGGCTIPAASTVGVKYCTNGSDLLSDATAHLTVAPGGTFTVLKPGLYRISFWTLTDGTAGLVRIDVNGSTLQKTSNGPFIFASPLEQSLDVTWRLGVNDTFDVWTASNAGNAYRAWAAGVGAAPESRLQVEYLGE